jgi:ribosomal protein S18 acetylase RimI-like enzyme
VDPDRQGIGIARSLLGRCIEHARALGFARLQLEVGRYNGRAQVLYRRLGFATESEGPEILVMRFDLRPEARLAG